MGRRVRIVDEWFCGRRSDLAEGRPQAVRAYDDLSLYRACGQLVSHMAIDIVPTFFVEFDC